MKFILGQKRDILQRYQQRQLYYNNIKSIKATTLTTLQHQIANKYKICNVSIHYCKQRNKYLDHIHK